MPLAILSLVGLLVMLGQGLVTPFLPLYGQSFGVGAILAGLLVSIFGLARMVTDIPAGYLSDRYGRKLVLFLGPALVALASLGAGITTHFGGLLFWRFVQGVGSAIYTTTASAAVVDLSNKSNTGRNLATYHGATVVGSSLGPGFGGVIGEYWGFNAAFFALAALSFLAALLAVFVLPKEGLRGGRREERRKERDKTADRASFLVMFSDRNLLLICMVSFSMFFSRAGARQTILPFLGTQDLHLSLSQVGFALTVISIGNFSTLFLAGYLADRYSRRILVGLSNTVAFCAFLGFAFSQDYFQFVAAAVILGISTGLGSPVTAAYVSDISSAEKMGLSMGLMRAFGDAGYVLGPIVLGFLSEVSGNRWSLAANGLFMVTVATLFLLLASETRRVHQRSGQEDIYTSEG